MEDTREHVVELDDGARLTTVSSGPTDGPPIVLCHGGPGLWDELGPVAALLEARHCVHRYDQRGCGRSTGPHDYRIDRAIADLDALRRHWGHRQWTVFGHSAGATLALVYAASRPEHTRAVIHCSGVGPGTEWRAPHDAEVARRLTVEQRERRDRLEQRQRTWDEEVEYRTLCWLPNYADPATAWELASEAASVPYAINWQANRELQADQPDLLELAPRVTAPTLIVHGEHDPRPSSNSHRLVDLIPDATFAAIPEAGHAPWVEAPATVATRLNAFLAGFANRTDG